MHKPLTTVGANISSLENRQPLRPAVQLAQLDLIGHFLDEAIVRLMRRVICGGRVQASPGLLFRHRRHLQALYIGPAMGHLPRSGTKIGGVR